MVAVSGAVTKLLVEKRQKRCRSYRKHNVVSNCLLSEASVCDGCFQRTGCCLHDVNSMCRNVM